MMNEAFDECSSHSGPEPYTSPQGAATISAVMAVRRTEPSCVESRQKAMPLLPCGSLLPLLVLIGALCWFGGGGGYWGGFTIMMRLVAR